MARTCISMLVVSLAILVAASSAEVVEHTFIVQNLTLSRLCNRQVITSVNGSLPGPTIRAREGDNMVVHVFNKSPYNITIHWHGIFQKLSGWADGPAFVTQCPIRPGNSYTYRFNITGQEGTLWWHAHVQWLRATVYGALIIRPKKGTTYPFAKPHREYPIILGEWWNANVIDVENEGLRTGGAPNISDAYTINGLPGHLYNCSATDGVHKITVEKGKTYLLRIINAALNGQFFFKIANHTMTVVALDASYTKPYNTDVVLVAPGQTTDVILKADQTASDYYMAAGPYFSAVGVPFANSITTAILSYKNRASDHSAVTPPMPTLPAFNDTPTAHKFNSNITSLVAAPHWVPVPVTVDEHMFVAFGLGLTQCDSTNGTNATCAGPFGARLAASMNNHSFQLPTQTSMLQAFFNNVTGVYTLDFPNNPPQQFDYTNTSLSLDQSLLFTKHSTSVKRVKFNTTLQVVLQNTALLSTENHPIHFHGFNFHVLAQGFGNFNESRDTRKLNLVDPQMRNTIGVPVGGWAVIRFTADNPGIWIVHCHLDVHLPWGLGMAFEVENGPTPESTLPPPPADLPKC